MSVIQKGLFFGGLQVLKPLLIYKPNSVHQYLTKILVEKKVKHIITTNFDDLFESALEDYINQINFYYSWQEIEELEDNFLIPSIIKLHGSFFDKNGDLITDSILTTTDSIYKSSVEVTLKKWAKLFSGYTIVFLGYSGRDRFDVIPMLSYLKNTNVIWICHNDEHTIKFPQKSDDILSKEVRILLKGNHKIIPLTCHTEHFLTILGKHINSQYDATNLTFSNSRRKSYPLYFPAIFPKYSYLVAGHLLDWAIYPREAGYAFSQFRKNCVDQLLLSYTSNVLGQVFERLEELQNAKTSYTIAIRGYWA
jgi:hypothetical protein